MNDSEILLHALQDAARRDCRDPGEEDYYYSSAYDFVVQHGIADPVVPFEGPRQPQLMCFGNAMANAALRGWHYVEGFVLAPDGKIILHGWNRDQRGYLYDGTWMNTGLAYIGVEFSVERADDALWNGDACILDDKHRGWPIFRSRWEGEDESVRWPPSDRLDALRAGRIELARSALEWMAASQGLKSSQL